MPFPLFVLGSSAIAATTMAVSHLSPWRWQAVAAGLIGATALLVFHVPGGLGFFADDSFITFRYSQHLADGLGPNWNSAGRVEGYTSFSWMLLMAGVAKLGVDLVDASRIIGFLAVFATFLSVYGIWRLWRDEDDGSAIAGPLLPAAVVLGLALTDGVPFWGFSGMETPLFMALLTGGCYLHFREQRGAGLPWSAVALAAAAMTRPEGIIAAAVTGTFTLADLAGATDRRRALTRVLFWSGLFLLLYGSYFIWRYQYYGYLLPNTYYAKVGPTTAVFERGVDYIWTSGLHYQLPAMFTGTAALLLSNTPVRRDAAYIIVLGALMLAAIVYEGGDYFAHGRFIAPLLPLLYLGGLTGFAALLKRLTVEPAGATLVAAAALTLAALSLFPHVHAELAGPQTIEDRRILGTWLREHTPPDYMIAAYFVGAVAYYSDRDTLDLLGVNDVVIAHTDVPGLGTGIAGHEKQNVDYVLDDVNPEIILPSDADPGPRTEEELQSTFNGLSPGDIRRALLTDERLWEHYEVRSLNTEGRWFNFLQRKDTVAELQAPGLE